MKEHGVRRCRVSRACAATSLALALLLADRACALRRDDYDLASLILESHAVVLAERGSQRHLRNWAGATTYTVKKVYRGNMAPEQRFEVFAHTNEYQATGTVLETFSGRITVDPDTILILKQWDPSKSGMQSWLPEDTPSLTVVTERFLAGGRVFEREDSLHVGGDGRPLAPVGLLGSLEEFEERLRLAIVKVERFSGSTRLQDPSERREAILAMIIPQSHALETGNAPLCREGYADRFRQRALELFAAEGDLDAALEVAARSGEGLGFHFQCPISMVQLLAAARREDVPSHRRVAALYLVARGHPTDRRKALQECETLLECKDLKVKRAAAHILAQALRIHGLNPRNYTQEQSRPIADALLQAWRKERDPAFRLAILRESKGGIFSGLLEEEDRDPEVLLLWEIREDHVAFTGEVLRGPPLHERSPVLVASDLVTNEVHRVPCGGWPVFSSAPGGESIQRPRGLLPPGRYRVWLELETRAREGGAPARAFRTESREIDIPERR